jgi:hypothetical protein
MGTERMRNWTMLAVVAGMAVVAGCASWEESARQDAFDRTVRAYAQALQWSDFAKLGVFVKPSAGAALDPDAYREFKITSYQPAAPSVAADGRTVRRSAAISYVRLSQMSEQGTTVQEEWVYAEDAKRWYLQSGWPVLK